MNKQILFALLLLISAVLTVGAISASDINVTDSYTSNLVDDTSDVLVPLKNTADSSEISVSRDSNVDNDSSKVSLSSEEVLESDDSNILSTNSDSNSLADGGSSAKTQTQISLPATGIYYKGSFSVTLKDSNGTALANKTVSFVINGVNYSGVTDSNGVASVALSLNPGKYTVTASFAGDNAADASNVSSTINILSTIASKDITKYYKGSTKYTATFYTSAGGVLANTNVKITVNGKAYTVKTNGNGVASLAVNLKPGTYKVIAQDPVTGYQVTNNFKILSTISASDISKVYSDGRKFTAKFLKSTGKVLAKKTIRFKINGKTYRVKTNANGVASLSLKTLKKGTYKIISYNTDGLTKTNTVKVVKSSSTSLTTSAYTFLKSETKKIKVRLLNKFGYAPSSGKVITFKINGKTYSAKTSSTGYATLKLPSLSAGAYTVKYSFGGTSYYLKSSASNKVYIIPTKNPTFTVKSTKSFGYGANSQFKVALTSGSVPLVKKTVTLSVDGKSYTKTTNSNGIVSLTINLPIGHYTVSYASKADSKINAKSGSTAITVKERLPTSISWASGSSLTQGSQSLKVLLKDSNGKAVSGRTVKLTLNSKTYTATTASNGYATFGVSVSPGNYTVSYKFDDSSDNDYIVSSGSSTIEVIKKASSGGFGYWLFGGDMKSVSLSTLASRGTSDIFLNFYAFTAYKQSEVESWIASANKLGMRVHIWMQTFYDGGSWVNPVKSGSPNTAFFNQKIAEAKKYAAVKGVAGIHFDYLRYPGNAYKTSGGTAAISQFVKQATEAVHSVNSNLIVSCALMPETTSMAYYYGQDYSVISRYMDVVVPMVYKGNYGKSASWITSTTKWFVDNSKGALVWTGLQGYKSDSNVAKLSTSEMTSDCQAALNGNAAGTIIFRYNICNLVTFSSLTTKYKASSTSTSTSASESEQIVSSVSLPDIVSAAYNLNYTIDSTNSIPTSVSIGGQSFTASQFLYLMTKAVEVINTNGSSEIIPVSASAASTPSGVTSGNLTAAEYLDLANRISSYIANNGASPNYATSSVGNIKYESLIEIFYKVLAYYKVNSELPDYIAFNDDVVLSNVPTTISVKDVITGASNLKTYYETNKALPNTVTAGGITFKLPEFLYVMSQAIYQIGNSNNADITYVSGVSDPSSPSGDTINADLVKDGYLTVAYNVANFITTYNQAPNYASSTVGKIIYSELVDAFSRILAFYGTYSIMPNYVTVVYGSSSSSSSSSSSISITGSGLNEKNTISDLSPYLKSTTNCQVNNADIKSVVNSLTSGLTTDLAKATAIFNYVRDKVSYSFYYNTKYGAARTLSVKQGNCVDHAHLLVAMFRTAGLPARYVHGTCRFSSGSTYGHVWAQVLVDGVWVVADATSSRNSLGKIANWNTNSYSLHGKYASLSF